MKISKLMEKRKEIIAKIHQQPYLQFVLFGGFVALIGLFAFTGIFPSYYISDFALIIIYTTAAIGLNLLLGFSGLISLATAGFIGIGALGTAVFVDMGVPFILAAILIMIIAGILGALIGLFSLKVEGIYLAIGTLFVGEILRQVFTNFEIFGGQRKSIGTVNLLGFITLDRDDVTQRFIIYLILVALLVVAMIIAHNIIKSQTGRSFMAISRSQSAAQAMGISLLRYRLTAFVIASLFSTLAGIMYILYYQAAPTTEWSIDLSLLIIAIVVVGGFKSIYGMFIGAFIIQGIPELFLKDIFGNVSLIFSGILIILVILFYPYGVVHIWVDLKRLYYKIKAKLHRTKVKTDDKK